MGVPQPNPSGSGLLRFEYFRASRPTGRSKVRRFLPTAKMMTPSSIRAQRNARAVSPQTKLTVPI